MKKSLHFFLLSFLLIPSLITAQDQNIQNIINAVDQDSLMNFVMELSGEVQTTINGSPYTILTRNSYQSGNDMAANYIKERLDWYGLATYDQFFGSSGRNVYGVQTGTTYPNQKYIICAHYDDMPSGSIAPGADDNASGTAAVLEAARVLSQYTFEYTIIYALWDQEEQGLIGSDYYATNAANTGENILGVVNMDMIAWDSDNNNIADIHARSVGSSLALKDSMVAMNSDYSLGLVFDIKTPGSTYSDHASFWYAGFGAILLIEDGTDFNNYYHTTNDRYIHFNNTYFLKMSQVSIASLSSLSKVIGVVPVELASFSANVVDNGIMLEWSTASETNNLGFEIERASFSTTPLQGWKKIGFVEGNGTTSGTNTYSFADNNITETGKYSYRLKQIDYDGSSEYSEVVEVVFDVPAAYTLMQNYPNPFNPSTTISFTLPSSSNVTLKIFDVLGNEIATLVDEVKNAGSHQVQFDAAGLPSGMYLYRLQTGDFNETRKMLLTK